MIPDVTPNGVFYLPPTGWLTSFYNPPRLQLLYLLIQHSMSVSEISTKLNWEQSGVSHQLQLLRKYNLVQQRREGKTVIYHLEDPQVMTMIADVLSHAEKII